MWKENLYQPVEILLREHDTFPIGEHQHSFFEMAYILEGTGSFVVNSVNGGEEHHNYYLTFQSYTLLKIKKYRML